MFLPSRALLPFSKYMWVNSISELRFFSLKPYSFPFQALQCWLLEQGNCSVWDMEQNTPGSQLPSSPTAQPWSSDVQSHLPPLQEGHTDIPDGYGLQQAKYSYLWNPVNMQGRTATHFTKLCYSTSNLCMLLAEPITFLFMIQLQAECRLDEQKEQHINQIPL